MVDLPMPMEPVRPTCRVPLVLFIIMPVRALTLLTLTLLRLLRLLKRLLKLLLTPRDEMSKRVRRGQRWRFKFTERIQGLVALRQTK
mmetsp:Transcript_12625/g.28020  ORF Transcript_12625/g.28020 Transcript_12625/m.28020 type:complete len:87 (-) Transcript_12625:40-300(-)